MGLKTSFADLQDGRALNNSMCEKSPRLSVDMNHTVIHSGMGLPNEPIECQFVGMDRTESQWNVSLLVWTGQGANGMSVCWHGQDREPMECQYVGMDWIGQGLKDSAQLECGGLSSLWDVTM